MRTDNSIALLGGGPSALFLLKRLVENGDTARRIDIFEKNQMLGAGMPYSRDGACDEHVTNVSDNEIPELVTSIADWIKTVDRDTLTRFGIKPDRFNEYKVLPRLLFGNYLSAQFKLLLGMAKDAGLQVEVHYNTEVIDVIDKFSGEQVAVLLADGSRFLFDRVVICTGHRWPCKYEGKVNGYYDSPYPPSKLPKGLDHAVGIKGSSLTAIDAVRTLARAHGKFVKSDDGIKQYHLDAEYKNFRIVLHTRSGMLPAVRFHLADSHLGKNAVLSPEQVAQNKKINNGFLSLDYVFEQNFMQPLKQVAPRFYETIAHLNMEAFVELMMSKREKRDAFELLQAEYNEAERSIESRESVYWKEMLAVLSFAMNYPAKYFSAEDMLRLQKTLMPLITVVIAFAPQSSVQDLLALHRAGVLELIQVGADSKIEPGEEGGAVVKYIDEGGAKNELHYKTFVDCVGQPHMAFEDLPFPSLLANRVVSPARLKFADQEKGREMAESQAASVETDRVGHYFLRVPGVAINDNFELADGYGARNERICMMAVPFMGGYNPDYSGLDFCEAASLKIVENWANEGFLTKQNAKTVHGTAGLKGPGPERGAA